GAVAVGQPRPARARRAVAELLADAARAAPAAVVRAVLLVGADRARVTDLPGAIALAVGAHVADRARGVAAAAGLRIRCDVDAGGEAHHLPDRAEALAGDARLARVARRAARAAVVRVARQVDAADGAAVHLPGHRADALAGDAAVPRRALLIARAAMVQIAR